MSFSAICGLISGILFTISAGWYVMDVAKGKVLPSIATFTMLSIINASQLASVIDKGVWSVLPFSIVSFLASTSVAVIGLKRKKFYLELPDKIGFIGALIGFLVWLVTKNAALNLLIISVTISITFTPVIIKGFKRPDLESILPWQLNFLASLFLLLTINSTALAVWIVPIRQIILSGLLNLGLYRGKVKLTSKQPA